MVSEHQIRRMFATPADELMQCFTPAFFLNVATDWLDQDLRIKSLEEEIKRLQAWAAFCYCCALSGQLPGTREEFHKHETASAEKGGR